jgi:hypothetical protein
MQDPELQAMGAVHDALEALDAQARERVLRWSADKFELKLFGSERAGRSVAGTSSTGSGDGEMPEFRDVGDLVHAAQPANGPQYALVMGYWLQRIEGKDGWGGGELNDGLKNLGHGLANVTVTLESLKSKKPTLVMQVGKAGRSRQARKTYKLTAAGVGAVQEMLSNAEHTEA